ncbi:hypothetical protein [Nostoc sp. WHI]|nr:hypothetical protein [Nostoc sp. WHI]
MKQLFFHSLHWLIEHQRSMGLVKAVRQRPRRTAAMSFDIWGFALT